MVMIEGYHDALPEGAALADFVLGPVLEQDAVSIYYKATDKTLGHDVVIAEYLPGSAAGRAEDGSVVPRDERAAALFSAARQRFLDDARVMAAINHPNLVRIARYFEANNTAYTVRPFIPGVDLMAHVASRGGGPMPEAAVTAMLSALGEALTVIHAAGTIHRQVEPARILIRDDDPAMLLHFGAAWQDDADSTLAVSTYISPGFAAIEQYADPENQGPWTDVYGLAATAYWAVTGILPIPATNRNLIALLGEEDPMIPLAGFGRTDLSPGFVEAVDWGLSLAPTRRPQTVSAFLAVLTGREARAAAEAQQPAATTPAGVSRHVQRSAAVAIVFAMAVLIAGLWLGGAL